MGLVVLARGYLEFRKAKTTIDPVKLERASSFVTSGIYRYTRNPMYVGFTAILASWAVGLAAPWAMLDPIFFFLLYDALPDRSGRAGDAGQVRAGV